jgi:SAM-dependent methyltransferase
MYRDLPPSVWETAQPRLVWHEILRFCEQHPGNETVLDVGCFAGDFLAWMPGRWRKTGIEPSIAARKVAEARGVEIVGDAIGSSLTSAVSPSIVTSIDVMEHVEYPFEALRWLRDLLADRGIVVIFTGAADCWSWRLFGRHYWYSALPEHVSFFTRKWFEHAASRLGMKVIAMQGMSSVDSNRRRFWFNFARLSLYATVQELRERRCPEGLISSLPVLGRAAGWQSVPWLQEATDHMLVVLGR